MLVLTTQLHRRPAANDINPLGHDRRFRSVANHFPMSYRVLCRCSGVTLVSDVGVWERLS